MTTSTEPPTKAWSDFAPPPKAKAQDDDEIETAAGEALAPAGTKTAELVDLMADNKMLQRDLATRDKEIADLKELLQKRDELLKAKDEEAKETKSIWTKEYNKMWKQLNAVRDELAAAKGKITSKGRRQTVASSSLRDLTNNT